MPDSNNAPEWVKESLTAYAETGRPTGDFLEACLSNDLAEAVGRADPNSMRVLPDIVAFIYNRMPSACWRSREAVRRWQRAGGLQGLDTSEKWRELQDA
jgi:hypothetical protein